MDATQQFDRRGGILYPMLLIAAVALTAFSIVGIATLTGTLPKALSPSNSSADTRLQSGAIAAKVESRAAPGRATPATRRQAPPQPGRQAAAG
jgi:hypothetical protein